MPGRTPREAYDSYAQPLRKILSCVTRDVLVCRGSYDHPNQTNTITFFKNPIQLSDSPYSLFLIQHFMIVGNAKEKYFKVKTQKYSYAIESHRDKQEVIAFHWDPESRVVHYAHTHVDLHRVQKKLHVPTGRVPIEDVIWFCIQELGVTPLHRNWKNIILEAREAFMKYKTW